MPEYDKSGWTVCEPSLCECIDVRIGSIPIKGRIKPVFILELVNLKTGDIGIKWLGVAKSQKGGYSVKPNSDLSKLYRLAIGYVARARYSKANQLLKHFIGCKFIAEFENAKGTNGKDYLRVKTIEPINPIVMDGWFSDGRLKDKNWKPTGNGLEINWKKSGNKLETQKAEKVHSYLASTAVSTPLKDSLSKIEPLSHTETIPANGEEYETTMTMVNGSRNYQFHQRLDETEDEYHARVIDESYAYVNS